MAHREKFDAASLGGSRPGIVLVGSHDTTRRELHLLLKSMGYEVRAHSSARTLVDDPLATHSDWLIIDVRHQWENIAALAVLRESGWCGQAVVITREKPETAQPFGVHDPDVRMFTHAPTAHDLRQLLAARKQGG